MSWILFGSVALRLRFDGISMLGLFCLLIHLFGEENCGVAEIE
jgi:hypothetical protein